MMSLPQINGGAVAKHALKSEIFPRLVASAGSDMHVVASSRRSA
jgi:hypothetical protein